MTDNTNKQIAALHDEIERLKAQQPTPHDPAAVAKAIDAAHQMREQRASDGALSHYTRDQLREMTAACPDPQALVRDHRGAPLGPTSEGAIPTSQTVSNVSSGAGLQGSTNKSGWSTPTPIRNGLGQGK